MRNPEKRAETIALTLIPLPRQYVPVKNGRRRGVTSNPNKESREQISSTYRHETDVDSACACVLEKGRGI